MNTRVWRSAAALFLILSASRAVAVTIFESATLGETGQLGGAGVVFGQGVRFTLGQTTNITAVGGHLVANGNSVVGYAAIAPLTSPTGFPTADPTSGAFQSSVLASTTFTVNLTSADLSIPLAVTLPAGTYGLIFGQNALGAQETAGRLIAMTTNNPLVAGFSDFFHFGESAWVNNNPHPTPPDPTKGLRFFVEGSAAPVSAPDAGNTLAMMVSAIGLIASFAHRRLR